MGYFITLCVGFLLGSILGSIANKKLKKRYQEELNKISKKCKELEKISEKEGE
jgi:phage FluMu protein gp41